MSTLCIVQVYSDTHIMRHFSALKLKSRNLITSLPISGFSSFRAILQCATATLLSCSGFRLCIYFLFLLFHLMNICPSCILSKLICLYSQVFVLLQESDRTNSSTLYVSSSSPLHTLSHISHDYLALFV